MSIAGYFEAAIREFYNHKKTLSAKKEMRLIIDRFYNDINYYHFMTEEEIDKLKTEIKKIQDILNE